MFSKTESINNIIKGSNLALLAWFEPLFDTLSYLIVKSFLIEYD